jgi:hypothetical protein
MMHVLMILIKLTNISMYNFVTDLICHECLRAHVHYEIEYTFPHDACFADFN